ncbi:MAG: hypothetical protein SGBAC_001871 [Bacillariaceae sp.]
MMAMITSEELECADILNDVGICFSEDFGLLETDVNHGFKPISKPTLTSRLMPSTKFVPVSPTPETTPEAPTSTSFEQFDLLAQMPRNVSQFSFQQQQVVPVLPSIMPDPAMTTAPANTIQRAVSDVSITAAIPSQLADAYNNRKRPLQGMLQARPEEQIRRKRNREHAKRSRQRKKAFTDDLTSTVEVLREETEKLRQELYAALGKDEVLGFLEERKRKEQQAFIDALKKPKNRVVDGSTLKFLKGLSKKVPKEE